MSPWQVRVAAVWALGATRGRWRIVLHVGGERLLTSALFRCHADVQRAAGALRRALTRLTNKPEYGYGSTDFDRRLRGLLRAADRLRGAAGPAASARRAAERARDQSAARLPGAAERRAECG